MLYGVLGRPAGLGLGTPYYIDMGKTTPAYFQFIQNKERAQQSIYAQAALPISICKREKHFYTLTQNFIPHILLGQLAGIYHTCLNPI